MMRNNLCYILVLLSAMVLAVGCEPREERLQQAEMERVPWETVVPDKGGGHDVPVSRLKVECGWLYHVRYSHGSAVFVPDGSCHSDDGFTP
jgi:hypothetical protein